MDAPTPASGFHMADVRRKRPSERRAVAVGELRVFRSVHVCRFQSQVCSWEFDVVSVCTNTSRTGS